jgi:hypothetical protein
VLAASFPAVDQRDADEVDAQRAEVPLSQMVSSVVLYDRAYEVSRDRNAEMQGVENGLLAILAAVAAVVVLAIDKLADLGFVALVSLALSFIGCAVGYLRGRVFALWSRQSEDPRRFFYDLILSPDEAHREGAEDLIEALVGTRMLLIEKRRWAVAAIVALIIGTVAGGLQKVVHSRSDGAFEGETSRHRVGAAQCRDDGTKKIAPSVCRVAPKAVRLDAAS